MIVQTGSILTPFFSTVVAIDQAESLIAQGWRFVTTLSKGKAVVCVGFCCIKLVDCFSWFVGSCNFSSGCSSRSSNSSLHLNICRISSTSATDNTIILRILCLYTSKQGHGKILSYAFHVLDTLTWKQNRFFLADSVHISRNKEDYLLLILNQCTIMGLFSRKTEICTICKKSVTRSSKPKKDWHVKGPLCTDCYIHLMKTQPEKKKENDDKCILCGAEPGGLNLWKPKKEWEIKGWLCEPCLNQKEKADNELKKNCIICNAKIGFIKYRSKKEWNMKGYLCKNCWETH